MKLKKIVLTSISGVLLVLFGYYLGVVSTVTDNSTSKRFDGYSSSVSGGSIKVIDSLEKVDTTEEPQNNLTLDDIKNREVTSLTMQVEHIVGRKAEKVVHQWDEEGKQYVAYLGYVSDKNIKEIKTEDTIKGYEYYYNGKKHQVREVTKSFKSGKTYKDVFGKKKTFYSKNNRINDVLKYDWKESSRDSEKINYSCTYKPKGMKREYKLTVDVKIGRIISFSEVVTKKGKVDSKTTITYSGYNTTVIDNVK